MIHPESFNTPHLPLLIPTTPPPPPPLSRRSIMLIIGQWDMRDYESCLKLDNTHQLKLQHYKCFLLMCTFFCNVITVLIDRLHYFWLSKVQQSFSPFSFILILVTIRKFASAKESSFTLKQKHIKLQSQFWLFYEFVDLLITQFRAQLTLVCK